MPAVLTPESTRTEVAEAAREAASQLIELRNTPRDARGDTYVDDVREAIDAVHHFDTIYTALELEERSRRPDPTQSRGGQSLGVDVGVDMRSMGAQVTDAEGFADWASAGRRSGPFAVEVRNLIGTFGEDHALDSGAQGLVPVGSPIMVPGSMQRRRAFVRDLMSVQSTGLPVVPYWREQNQLTNETGAQMTMEGSAKAEVTLEFERYDAVVQKISAWLPVTEEAMTDAPTLAGYINSRLDYMLMIREEQQVINGNGTAPQLVGLESLSGSGLQTQALISTGGPTGGTGDYPATIGAAIGKIENVDGDADGVVTNPLDYWGAIIKRHGNQFDHGFGSGAPASVGGVTWGLRAVRTRAVTTGTAYVGAWALGSTLFDRQQTTIKVGDQHSDNFVKNILVVLAEKRVATAWHRANLFVKATVPTG